MRPYLLSGALCLALVTAIAGAAPPDRHPMLGARNRRELAPSDLGAFYAEVARSVDARLFAHLADVDDARTRVQRLATIVDAHRNWTGFTAVELDEMTAQHNALIELLALDGEDKISCVRANVVGSRITAAVCGAWGP